METIIKITLEIPYDKIKGSPIFRDDVLRELAEAMLAKTVRQVTSEICVVKK